MNTNTVLLAADVNNLYYCLCKKYVGRKLDYDKLLRYASTFGTLHRATAYGTAMGDEAIGFITCLRRLGYEVKYKKPRASEPDIDKRTARRSEWNVGIAMDVIKAVLNHRLDCVVLATSNAEMHPLMQWVRERGVFTVIVGCGIPRELKDSVDAYIEIMEDLLEDAKSGLPSNDVGTDQTPVAESGSA